MKTKLKLLHTADLHLGAAFTGLGSQGNRQRERLREVLKDIAALAEEEHVHLVLLAGDTFNGLRPSPESFQALQGFVKRLEVQGIPVIAIAGTHDHLAQNTTWQKLGKDLGRALVLLTPEHPVWEIPELGVRLSGVSLVRQDEPERPLAMLRRDSGFSGWQIGMAHAALDMGRAQISESHFSPAEVAETGLDYLALGHWHGIRDCSEKGVAAWYSGAPEMIALDETGSGQVLLVSLEEGHPVRVTPHRVGKRSWIHREASALQPERILETIKTLADPNAVLDLTLTGFIPPGQSLGRPELAEALAPLFFHVRIHDQTQAEYSPEMLSQYPDTTVIGRFIRLLSDQIEQAEEPRRGELRKAMQLGMAYLLGSEVALWS